MQTFRKYILFTFCSLLLCSCAHIDYEDLGSDIYFTAGIAQSDTKTGMSNHGDSYKVYWQTGDKLAVFSGAEDEYSMFSLVSGENTSEGVFKGFLVPSDSYSAIYPYEIVRTRTEDKVELSVDSVQKYSADGLPVNSLPMYACGKLGSLNFRLLGAILKIQLTGSAILKSIMLSSNGDEAMAGDAVFDLSEKTSPQLLFKDNRNKQIVLDCDGVVLNESVQKDFYIVVPGHVFKEGFTLVVNTYSGSFTKILNHEVAFVNGEMRSLEPFVVEGDALNPDTRPAKQMWYKSKSSSPCTINESAFDAKIISQAYNKGWFIVTFDELPTKINDVVFENPSSVIELYLPNSVEHIGMYAFSGIGVSEINFPESLVTLGVDAYSQIKGVKGIKLPEGVRSIGLECFGGCSSLEYVSLPSTLEETEPYAFLYCDNLVEFSGDTKFISSDGRCFFTNSGYGFIDDTPSTLDKVAGKDLVTYTVPDNVCFIQNYAFSSCKELKSITFPSSVNQVSGISFEGCDNLIEMKGPYVVDGRSFIYDGCLTYVLSNGLSEYTTPKGVKSLGSGLFNGDKNIKILRISEGVVGTESYGTYLFSSMRNIETIYLPSTITELGYEPFIGSEKLKSVYIKAKVPPCVEFDSSYENPYKYLTIYVPQESLQLYRESAHWEGMRNYIKGYSY